MKTWEQLTESQQEKALDKAVENLLTDILEGAIRFSDEKNHDNLQAKINAACEKAEQMRTPWFASEYIMDTCLDEIRGLAQCDAEDALYLEPSETAVSGIL